MCVKVVLMMEELLYEEKKDTSSTYEGRSVEIFFLENPTKKRLIFYLFYFHRRKSL